MNEHFIIGPPGTGKTTAVSPRIDDAVRRYGKKHVVVASFSRAATNIVRSRTGLLPRSNARTLHSFGWRSMHAAGDQPRLMTTADRKAFNHDASPAFRLGLSESRRVDAEIRWGKRPGDRLRDRYSYLRHSLTPPDQWPGEVRSFADAYERFKREHGLCDFDDLILDPLEWRLPLKVVSSGADGAHAEVESVQAIFIDEAQDCTPAEVALVRQWTSREVTWAMDFNQSVYEFKAGKASGISVEQFEPANITRLERGYRLPRDIWRYSQRTIADHELFGQPQFQPKEGPAGAVIYRPDLTLASPIEIVNLATALAEQARNVLILASCDSMLDDLLHYLSIGGVPFGNRYLPDEPRYNPATAKTHDFLQGRVETYVDDKGDEVEAAVTPLARVRAFLDFPWSVWSLATWFPLARQFGILTPEAAEYLANANAASEFDLPLSEHDLRALFVDEGTLDQARFGRLRWLVSNANARSAAIVQYLDAVDRQYGLEALVKPRITVSTIHGAKGADGYTDVLVLPDLSPKGWDSYSNPATHGAVARQYYVAVTRSSENLLLLGPGGPQSWRW